MQSYLTIYKGKAKTELFKMDLCVWICRNCKILKSVCYIIGRTYYSKVMSMYIGIAGKAIVSNTALAWLGNWNVHARTNSSMECMLRDPGEATVRANVARRALRATVFIYYTGSQNTREVIFVTKQGRYALPIASDYSRSEVTYVFGKQGCKFNFEFVRLHGGRNMKVWNKNNLGCC